MNAVTVACCHAGRTNIALIFHKEVALPLIQFKSTLVLRVKKNEQGKENMRIFLSGRSFHWAHLHFWSWCEGIMYEPPYISFCLIQACRYASVTQPQIPCHSKHLKENSLWGRYSNRPPSLQNKLCLCQSSQTPAHYLKKNPRAVRHTVTPSACDGLFCEWVLLFPFLMYPPPYLPTCLVYFYFS